MMQIREHTANVASLVASALVTLGCLALAGLTSVEIRAAPLALFVRPDGSGGACSQAQPCGLQTALDQASAGANVYVAQGTYTGAGAAVITLTQSVHLYGGWDGAASGPLVRDAALFPSVLDGQRQRRGVYISGPISPTLDGFVITRGNATGLTTGDCAGFFGSPDGCGGGIFVVQADPLISNNVITDNVAATSATTGTTAYGGGIYVGFSERAVISGNLIISNVASLANSGTGGGLCVDYGSPYLQIVNNRVISNVAAAGVAASPAQDDGSGGGISLSTSDSLVAGNLLQGNAAYAGACPGGGECSRGSGLFLRFMRGTGTTIRDNRVIGNHGGQALYLASFAGQFQGNQVLDNLTDAGLVLVRPEPPAPTLVNNVIARSGQRSVWVRNDLVGPMTITLLHNTLVGADSGFGVVAGAYATVYLTNTIVVSHAVGLTNTSPANATLAADHTLFWGNAQDGPRGTNPVDGEPRFANPAGGDYRLSAGSAAVDTGRLTGLITDMDGEPRPMRAGVDIGADELPPAPLASFMHSAPTTPGQTVAFTNTSVVSGIVAYRWDFGDGSHSTAIHVSHVYSTAGLYLVVLTATSVGGTSVATDSVGIYGASFQSTNPDWLGQTSQFTNTSFLTGTLTYQWAFGDGGLSLEQNPTHTYLLAGRYTVVLTVTPAVAGSRVATGTLNVFGPPGVTFTAQPGWVGAPTSLTASVTTTPPDDPGVSITWDLGDGSLQTGASISHTYAGPGPYTLLVTATNPAGSGSFSGSVSPYHAAFISSGPDWLGQTSRFTSTSTTSGPATYQWSFGDGSLSTQANPTHTYLLPGSYAVVLSLTNAAGSGAAAGTLDLFGPPGVTFTASSPAAAGQAVVFTAAVTTTPPGDGSVGLVWDFGDGLPQAGPAVIQHTYTSTGAFNVVLTATNAAGKSSASATLAVSARLYLPLLMRARAWSPAGLMTQPRP